MKKLSTILKKLTNKKPSYFHRISYFKYVKKCKIIENSILLEPQQGRNINGNIFYILKELATNKIYENYQLNVVLKPNAVEAGKQILKYHQLYNVNVIEHLSKKYYQLLASSKYLITDTSFLPFFIKKEGQVLFNTWHGTPLKYLGKKIKNDYHSIGNVQKNFLVADYLLYPNEYMMKHMIEDYMLENICKAKTILTGYPRNTAFFDEDSKMQIKKELEIEDKEVLVYMPTYREKKANEAIKNNAYYMYHLLEIEKRLKPNQILYVNFHPLERENIYFEVFTKVKQFPENYETYQFLNIADCLITDYSSVFFDFAITRKKIILFCYDEEEYLSTRGLYFGFEELPFTKVTTVEALVKAINSPKDYKDEEFVKKYCQYDNKEVTKKLCEKIILQKENDLKIDEISNNHKENILIYVGNLAKNGITSSIRNLLSNIDTNEKNYYLTFSSNKIKNNKEQLFTFPENVKYISTVGKTNMTIMQKILFKLYKKNLIPLFIFKRTIKKVYSYEIKRLYGDIHFDSVIQFCGYEYKKILFYSVFDCNNIIYVHSDMLMEIKTRKIQHRKTLKYAYQAYDKVAIVNKDLMEATSQISKKKDNIYVSNNIINYENVVKKAETSEIIFDETTECNISLEELKQILDGSDKIFITIGRFSPEKGHTRLIQAFNQLYQENKNIYLIIIGGLGKEYEKVLELVKQVPCGKNIIIIKSISNPYTILNKSDYFVLSSFYEGFGLVIAEANILGKPVISTNVVGPRSFMKENGGTLVENNQEGLYQGMKKLLNNQVPVMEVDYEQYNKKAIEEFYNLLKEDAK